MFIRHPAALMARLRLSKHFRSNGGAHTDYLVSQALESAALSLETVDLLTYGVGGRLYLLVAFEYTIGALNGKLSEVGPIAFDLPLFLLYLTPQWFNETFFLKLLANTPRNLENRLSLPCAALAKALSASFP